MRTQGQARFTGQDFHARVGAASMVQDAIAEEQGRPKGFDWTGELDYSLAPIHVRGLGPSLHRTAVPEAILPNSQEKPHYSPVVNMVIGAAILVSMLTGVYLGVRYGR